MKGFYVVLLLFPNAGCAIIVTKPTDGNGPLGVFPGNQPEGVLPGAKLEATTDSGVITGYAIVEVVPDDNTFDIDADTGQLSLAAGKAFGFETTTEYVLKIDVTDSTVTATATVTITIREDDEVPMFKTNPTVMVDNEAAVGFNVITYPASDKEDDEQTYSIVHECQISWIKPKDGSGTIGTVEEDAEAGLLKDVTVLARAPGVTITYAIIGASNRNNMFSIDTRSGQISLVEGHMFDYEAEKTYTLLITATDLRIATITATATLSISDFNEAPPIFDDVSRTVKVDNAAPVGTFVTTSTATDVDTDETITYALIRGNKNADFRIGIKTGVIQVAKVLNSAITTKYTLTVLATENGVPPMSSSATVVVNVCASKCGTAGAATIQTTWEPLVSLILTFFIAQYI